MLSDQIDHFLPSQDRVATEGVVAGISWGSVRPWGDPSGSPWLAGELAPLLPSSTGLSELRPGMSPGALWR